jgi:ADP-ribosyl-[dinitrogen reductase] hydrolase
MLGAIAGDIIGSRFEGHAAPPADFELFHRSCRFTDDSVCTVAVAEAVLEGRDIAQTLRAFVRRHPDRGYGGMFMTWALSDGAPPYGSWGNGAPMRVGSIGWLAESEAQARRLAVAQAAVSHDHPDAMAASEAVALAVFLLRSRESVLQVRERIVAEFDYDLDPRRVLMRRGFDISAVGTVGPAMTAAFESEDWQHAVRTAVCLGGDTDTLACIAGTVAEAIHGIPEPVSERAMGYLTADLREVVLRFRARLEGRG